MHGQQNIKSR